MTLRVFATFPSCFQVEGPGAVPVRVAAAEDLAESPEPKALRVFRDRGTMPQAPKVFRGLKARRGRSGTRDSRGPKDFRVPAARIFTLTRI